MDAGDKIKTKLGAFSFGGSTSKNFDKHVSKSVPLYDECRDIYLTKN